MLPEEDLVRLGHMRDVTREALSCMENRTREDLWQDSRLARAVTACLMILGEAANNISAATQAIHPEIAWSDIIAMRHKLIHAYLPEPQHRVADDSGGPTSPERAA